MSKAQQVLDVLPCVEAAWWEDAAGAGVGVGPLLAARLNRIRNRGSSLPPCLRRAMEQEFDCCLSRVRLHVDFEVDEVAAMFGARAFCLGSDVFLGRGALHDRGGALPLDVLRHELAHVAHRIEYERIRFWGDFQGRDIHAEITQAVCDEFDEELKKLVQIENINISKEDLIEGLKIAATNMDYRKRVTHARYYGSVIKSGWSKFNNWLDKKIGKSFPSTGIAGEGPSHGEGHDYAERFTWSDNVQMNQDEQDKQILEARDYFERDRKHWIDDVIGTIRHPFGFDVAVNEKEWIKSLGNALHVAQDRASHREGMHGMGHDDPRCYQKPGWDPDAPVCEHTHGGHWTRCSTAAVGRAKNNSYAVMIKFFQEIKIKPHTPEPAREMCSAPEGSPLDGFKWQRSPYPNPFVRTVFGRSAYPRGR